MAKGSVLNAARDAALLLLIAMLHGSQSTRGSSETTADCAADSTVDESALNGGEDVVEVATVDTTNTRQRQDSSGVQGMGNGGWRRPSTEHKALDTGAVCNIKQVTLTTWQDRHFTPGGSIEPDGPIVIRVPVEDQAEFRYICTRAELLRRFGHKAVTLSSANSHSYDKLKVPFSEYVYTMIEPMGIRVSSVTSRTLAVHVCVSLQHSWCGFLMACLQFVWELPPR
jgi:hypothetical protein